jgi:T-complex protein 1 subunit alpha
VNAAKDSTELVAQLRSRHALSQRTPTDPSTPENAKQLARSKGYKNYGLDLANGKVHDCLKAGVLEPSMSKVKQLKSAVEACVAIMRIDTLIQLDPEERGGGEDDGHGH